VPSGSTAGHHKGQGQLYPSFSLTLNNIPSEASVLKSELPPKLIMRRGKPLVGAIPTTTLMLIKA